MKISESELTGSADVMALASWAFLRQRVSLFSARYCKTCRGLIEVRTWYRETTPGMYGKFTEHPQTSKTSDMSDIGASARRHLP